MDPVGAPIDGCIVAFATVSSPNILTAVEILWFIIECTA